MADSFTFENANEMRTLFSIREVNNVDPTRMLPHYATLCEGINIEPKRYNRA